MALADAYRRSGGRMPRAPARQLGNWKLAYADFLTALVALFLVFWLVTLETPNTKSSIASYFRGHGLETATTSASEQIDPAIDLVQQLQRTRLLATKPGRFAFSAGRDTVRIEIMDQTGAPMFASGSSTFTPEGIDALGQISKALSAVDWPFSIEGHTDAFPSLREGTDNMTLSLLRANEARRLLLATDLDKTRIAHVSGFGATRPLRPEEPHLSANRRITLILHIS